MLGTILIILLILIVVNGFGGYVGPPRHWGNGGLGLVVIILLILVLIGRI